MNSIAALLETLQPRAAMYVGQHSISCLAACIDGWLMAKGDDLVDGDVFQGFQAWVEDTYKMREFHKSWDKIILFHSQDEADAVDWFFELFKTFRETQV